MSIWWITTIGFIICLGFICGIFVYGLKNTLHSDDATRVDPLPKEKD